MVHARHGTWTHPGMVLSCTGGDPQLEATDILSSPRSAGGDEASCSGSSEHEAHEAIEGLLEAAPNNAAMLGPATPESAASTCASASALEAPSTCASPKPEAPSTFATASALEASSFVRTNRPTGRSKL